MVRLSLIALIFFATALAATDGYYLETPPLSTRAEALEIQQLAQEGGISARVVRRYEHGSGWEYLVIAEGFESRTDAEVAAGLLAEQTGRGITVYEGEQTGGRRLNARVEGWTGASLDPGAVAQEPAPAGLPEAQEILAHAVRAIGGESGGAQRIGESPAVVFSYTRVLETPAGMVHARHDLALQGDDLRLEIKHLDGPGVDSKMLVVGQEAWVQTAESGTVSREPARVREVLGDFGPDVVLAWPLGFAERATEDPAFASLRVLSLEDYRGRMVYRLETSKDLTGESFQLLIDAEQWTISQVNFRSDSGDVRYEFGDWRELDTGLVVPFEQSLLRDGRVVESLVLSELLLLDQLPPGMWAPLGGGGGSLLRFYVPGPLTAAGSGTK